MGKTTEERAHLEWIGYVQPVGLIVSIPAMLNAQCQVQGNISPVHRAFLKCLVHDEKDEPMPLLRDLAGFAKKVLEWEDEDLVAIPHGALSGNMAPLEVVLPQYDETLRPTYAVPEPEPAEDAGPAGAWSMLVQELRQEAEFDKADEADSSRKWKVSPQAKFERLLRESGVSIGILSNMRQLRLVYAPRGESSGHATFNVDEMMQVAGRPMFAALHMLLCAPRMFTLGKQQRLPAILEDSRKYQNTVSTQLAEQVLAALYELMRGFQAANDDTDHQLLGEILKSKPNHVYSGLLTVLMRLVFVLYAEDRDLMSSDPIYSNHYSVTGLFKRLREDNGRFPDTMHQRYGAWAQLITLFRMIHDGGQHDGFKLPPRQGYLFDPERYPFLEGRASLGIRDWTQGQDAAVADVTNPAYNHQPPVIPRISDGVIYNVLNNLLILDGERLSYRTLDVEQIGSVYETVMGFNLETAAGRSIAIKPAKTHGAAATINLDALLETAAKDRAKWLKEQSDQNITGAALKELKEADSIETLVVALDRKIQKKVTPRVVPKGALVLQPSDERRRSGSHYTPRSLTEPIVRTTLEPILKGLTDPERELPKVFDPGDHRGHYLPWEIQARIVASQKAIEYTRQAREIGTPHPSQILDLKICDPAMGSGAFLVETCRQLGDELIKAWYAHDAVPTDIPPDEDEVLYARRLVAQRCLYGVDKNEMAVDLAKLSLWLVTLARDHAFTFLDHSLRHGDSLVGLTREQIIGFHWDWKKFKTLLNEPLQKRLDRATEARAKILNAREDVPYRDQEQRLAVADEALDLIRTLGDACVSCFFAESKKKAREEEADWVFSLASSYLGSLKQQQVDHASRQSLAQAAARLAHGEHPVPAFHWEIEFPEVFSRENGGFDAFVGNPPFAGKNTVSAGHRSGYLDWVKSQYAEAHGNSDLVAYFFRKAFDNLRPGCSLGFVTTNTVCQGDTRHTGLRWICNNGGTIYNAIRRQPWPGVASVIVSIIHITKSVSIDIAKALDGKQVELITAFLYHAGSHDDPHHLAENENLSFIGTTVLGMGFTFDDEGQEVATPISEMRRLCNVNKCNRERIFPYIGGNEVANSQRILTIAM